MAGNRILILVLCLIICLFIESHEAFDDDDERIVVDEKHHEHRNPTHTKDQAPLPKDKILLKDIKTLIFYRNKRTTARRTHSIHQLSCVGGTAGCRLFTPEAVECTNAGFDNDKSKFNWRCHSEVSDRVTFGHVEVICEGYDYPEDDYILLGSCGLEFTLDYKDPHDAHDKSYFHHMDDHEKEMHHDRVRATAKPRSAASSYTMGYQLLEQLIQRLTDHMFLIGLFVVFVLCSILLVRFISSGKEITNQSTLSSRKQGPRRNTGYGPLTSAVMTTKKAC